MFERNSTSLSCSPTDGGSLGACMARSFENQLGSHCSAVAVAYMARMRDRTAGESFCLRRYLILKLSWYLCLSKSESLNIIHRTLIKCFRACTATNDKGALLCRNGVPVSMLKLQSCMNRADGLNYIDVWGNLEMILPFGFVSRVIILHFELCLYYPWCWKLQTCGIHSGKRKAHCRLVTWTCIAELFCT